MNIEKKIEKCKNYFGFRNEILGFFKTEKEMNQAIEDAGLIKRDGVYFIPTERYIHEKTIRGQQKAGETYIGVAKKFLNYKKEKMAIEG